MSDNLQIKAINGQLTWNKAIVDVIDKTCYNIDFLTNKIEVFLSRGELFEGIDFIRAKVGTYQLDEINDVFFDDLTVELLTPENEVRKFIQTRFDILTTTALNNNQLKIKYNGTNSAIPSTSKLISDKTIDLNNTDDWSLQIADIRQILKSEYRFYSYDYHYSITYNYGWLEFKDIEILGLSDFNFRAYFHYNGEGIIHIETIIGNTISEFENISSHFINLLGQPTKTNEDRFDSGFNHHFKDVIWLTDKFEIRLHSAYISRSEPEQFNYELEIKKYCA
jgi:hypothetical protein